MKILMVLEKQFPPDTRVEKEAKSLMNAGHQVHIASPTFTPGPQETVHEGIKIHYKKISAFTYKSSIGCLRFPFYFNFWRHFIGDLFKEYSFDAIHVHDLPLAQIGIEIKNRYKIPFILDLHENFPSALEIAQHTNTFPGSLFFSSKQWRTYERYAVQQADKVIAVVQEMKNRITELGIPSEKIVIVENTPDLSNHSFQSDTEHSHDPDHIHMIYLGGINIHRGLQIVIRGMPEIIKEYPNVVLDIYGNGRYLNALQKLSLRLKVNGNVFFHGSYEQNEAINIISKADITLIPHLKSEQTDNSSPNKLYQYLLLGKFVIASNCESISRIIHESECGMIYNHDSPHDFAIKTLTSIAQKKYQLTCTKGMNLIQKKYNWDVSVKTLLNIYRQIETESK